AWTTEFPRPLPLESTSNWSGHMPPTGATPAPFRPVQHCAVEHPAGRDPPEPHADGGTSVSVCLTATSASVFALASPPLMTEMTFAPFARRASIACERFAAGATAGQPL